VIVVFALADKDPVLNLFFWFSGLAVVAIVLVEFLVCMAVVAFFRRHPGDANVWKSVVAPILAALGLLMGEYLLMSRFGLLAGTVAKGVDPTAQAWGLSFLGYVLVFLPFVVFIIGAVVGVARRRGENVAAVADLVG
jgi:amino acid transporter